MLDNNIHTLLYPLFLSLKGKHCLLVGFGHVGQRRLPRLLLSAPDSVLVLDTVAPSNRALPLLADSRVHFERRGCSREDIIGKTLVFAATDNKTENARIADLAQKAGVLCNCASVPESGSFFVPAVARQGVLAAALSTGGASPALARRWRRELKTWLAPRARTASLLGRMRPLILALRHAPEKKTQLFQKLASSPLQQWLADDEFDRCREWLKAEMPVELHAHITELLNDLS
ncbi:MAG: bifunctional precorrin-2 dehydrogenase/sirohydrochlorin ferrochelatase [Desulfovibrio sp.]|nr:bifunctional precorrin-2 dehydrogenase/sirohydrochlorin ferrochelatase [Desulfovibrio sp.]